MQGLKNASKLQAIQQFGTCLNLLQNEPPETHIFFGGNLSLANHKISGMHGDFMTENMDDMWISAGKPAYMKFTFDLSKSKQNFENN